MREYIVSGVPLRDPLGEWFIDYRKSSLFTDISRALNGDSPYGYHGDAVPREGFFGTGKETIVLNVIGSSQADFEANFRGFHGLFSRPEFTIVSAPQRTALSAGTARFGQSFAGSSDIRRQSTFRMVGSMAVERIDAAAARLTIIVENRLAFWRSVNSYTTSAAGMSGTIDLTGILEDSNAPVTEGFIRLQGPLTGGGNVLVQDRDRPRSLQYTGNVASGEYVVINIANLKAKLQSSDTWSMSGGTDVSSNIDVTGDGPMYFSPGDIVGFPNTAFDYNAVVTNLGGSGTVELRLKRSYLS